MIERLGLVLLHFVWEGAAIGLVLALLLLATRRAPADLRYGLALAGLALLAVSPVATFLLLAPSRPVPVAVAGGATYTSGLVAAGRTPNANPLDLVVALWAVGAGVLSLRLVGTLLTLARWRRRHARPASDEAQASLDRLARGLGVRRRVALLLSDQIEVPSAWGVLRPLIVMPASLMMALPPVQVEGILLHELAHVRRHDYLVNLLQSVVETLLFYHPAVWWVSSVVRREREHLCDDLAVAALGDPAPYVRALLHLEERRRAPRPALSAKEGKLMNRIARLLAPRPAPFRPTPLAPSLAALAVVALALGGAYRANAQGSRIERRTPVKAAPRTSTPIRQAWHKPDLDLTVHEEGDEMRISAHRAKSMMIAYYRIGEPDQTWEGTDIRITLRRDSKDPALFHIDAFASKSHIVAAYRRSAGTRAAARKLPTMPLSLSSEKARQARIRAEIAVLSAKLAVQRRKESVDPNREKTELGLVRARVEAAQAALLAAQADVRRRLLDSSKAEAGYGKPGKPLHPTWSKDEHPSGVSVLTGTKAEDVRAFAEAQRKLAGDARKKVFDLYWKYQKQSQDEAKVQARTQALRSLFPAKAEEGLRFSRPITVYGEGLRFSRPITVYGAAQPSPRDFRILRTGERAPYTYSIVSDSPAKGVPTKASDVTVTALGFSLDCEGVSFPKALRDLAKAAGLSIVIAPGDYRGVNLVLKDAPAVKALVVLCEAGDATYVQKDGVYYVTPRKG